MHSQLLSLALGAAFALPAASMAIPSTVADLDSLPLLEPIIHSSSLAKRADNLDLKDDLRLDWGNANITATFDMAFHGENEHIINMEDFGDVLERVDCTAPHLALDFKGQESFDAAIKKWTWVNEKTARSFLMIVNHPACGRRNVRQPFNITNIKYDNQRHIAYLEAKQVEFKAAVHTGHLHIETRSAAQLETRASVSKSVSIAKDLTGNIFTINSGNNKATLDCTDCGVTGGVNVILDVSVGLFKINSAYIEFRPENVGARFNLALAGQLEAQYKDHKELASYAAVGFNIPGVAELSIGPAFGVGWGASLTGNGRVTIGASATLAAGASSKVCLKGCNTGNSGFKVNYATAAPTVQGSLTAGIDLHTYVTLSATASILSTGYEAGLALLAPKFDGSLTATYNSAGGACSNPAMKLGLTAAVNVGVKCYAFMGKNYLSPSQSFPILEETWPLYKQCFPFAG